MRRFLLLLSVAIIAGCLGNSTEPANNPSDPATETFDPSLGINIAQMQKTTSGVYYQDVTTGTGDSLIANDSIAVDYKLYLKNAYLVDSASGQGLQMDSLITGLDDGLLALPHMRIGGRRKMVIPSALGYANDPNIPQIPPNSTLIFDVTLRSIFH